MSFTYRLICPACRKNTPVKTWTVPEIITPHQHIHNPDKSYHILQIVENRGRAKGFPTIGATDVIPDEFYMDIVEYFKRYHGGLMTAIDVLDEKNPELANYIAVEGKLVTVELPSGEKIIAASENVQGVLDIYHLQESIRGEAVEEFKKQHAERRRSNAEKHRASLEEWEREVYDMMLAFNKAIRGRTSSGYIEKDGTLTLFKKRTQEVVFQCRTEKFYSLMEILGSNPIRV